MNRKQHFWLGAGTSGIHRVISYLDDCHQKGVQPDLAVGLSKTIRAMFTGGYSKEHSREECKTKARRTACYNRCSGLIFDDCKVSECLAGGDFSDWWCKDN